MEKLLLWRDKITKWFTSQDYDNWKTVFFALSILVSIFVTFKFGYNPLIFWVALVISVVISWSLSFWGTARIKLESGRVFGAWGFINYSLFVTIASSLFTKEYYGNEYLRGFSLAFATSILLVVFCSYVSYLLRLNPTKEDNDSDFCEKKSKFNGCTFYFIVVFCVCVGLLCKEGNAIQAFKEQQKIEQTNTLFKQAKWYPVLEWHTEILNGYTIYVIKCARGNIGIYPADYPQVRDINSKTRIKYVSGYQKAGLIFPKKFEIKN